MQRASTEGAQAAGLLVWPVLQDGKGVDGHPCVAGTLMTSGSGRLQRDKRQEVFIGSLAGDGDRRRGAKACSTLYSWAVSHPDLILLSA